MIPFIDLRAQQARIRDGLDASMARVLEHGQYIMGPEVAELESVLAGYCGVEHALACASGTDALVLALMALGIGEGDAVFAPAFTFVATVEAVSLVGATPVFVDADSGSFNLCPDSLAEAVDAVRKAGDLRPRAVMPVDLFGQPADYRAIGEIAAAERLEVVADAAQSFGAQLDGVRVGRLARVSTTSFFPAKPLGCYGDGGAVFTDDEDLARLIVSLRNHGQGGDKYDNVRVGLNSRLDTLQAAILLEKLKIFDDELRRRDDVAARYRTLLGNDCQVQRLIAGATSSWAQFTLLAEDREGLRGHLKDGGIPTAVYYPKPNHLQGPYLEAPRAPKGLPVTEHLQQRVVSLPMHPYLSEDLQDRIVEQVLAFRRNRGLAGAPQAESATP